MEEENSENSPTPFRLSQGEIVVRHQLNLMKFWDEKSAESAEATKANNPTPCGVTEIPDKWNLLGGSPLRDWQVECRERWFGSGKRGVVKVVTGAGKTIMALGIIEALQNRECSDLRVAIVVPTIVLQDQWYDLLIGFGNLPASAIGLVGGSHRDSFDSDKRILVSVLNSAATKLPKMAESLHHPLLLVVDECHRAGSTHRGQHEVRQLVRRPVGGLGQLAGGYPAIAIRVELRKRPWQQTGRGLRHVKHAVGVSVLPGDIPFRIARWIHQHVRVRITGDAALLPGPAHHRHRPSRPVARGAGGSRIGLVLQVE